MTNRIIYAGGERIEMFDKRKEVSSDRHSSLSDIRMNIDTIVVYAPIL